MDKNEKNKKIIDKTMKKLLFTLDDEFINVDKIQKIYSNDLFPLSFEMVSYIIENSNDYYAILLFLDAVDKATIKGVIKQGINKAERYDYIYKLLKNFYNLEEYDVSLFCIFLEKYFDFCIRHDLIKYDFFIPSLAGFSVNEVLGILVAKSSSVSKTGMEKFQKIIEKGRQLKSKHIEDMVSKCNLIGLRSKLENYCNSASKPINTLLILPFSEDMTKAEILVYYYKLFEVGIDPNIRFVGCESFIETFIKNSKFATDTDFICDLIKLAIKYGFDINEKNTILPCLLDKDVNIFKILKLLIDNGYDINNSDLDFVEIINKLNGNFWNFKNSNTSDSYELIKFTSIITKLKEKLESKKYEVEGDFLKILLSAYYELSDLMLILCPYYYYDDGVIANNWMEAILESRNNNVNKYEGCVSVIEAIDGLRSLLNEISNEMNSNIDDSKIIVLNYKK